MASSKKSCFVIAPIGSEESETRKRSDQVLKHIIKPAAEECGYKAVRADEISEPGVITTQVIQRLIEDDLVIADLTERNPNVFYELAIRHAIRKPVVQIIKRDEKIPFDVTAQRTIQYDLDLDSAAACKEELIRQIRAAEKEPEVVDSPVATAIDLGVLRGSENPVEKSIVEIVPMLEDIRSMVQGISVQSQSSEGVPRDILEEIVSFNECAVQEISSGEIKTPSGEIRFLETYVIHLKKLLDIFGRRVPKDGRDFMIDLRIIQDIARNYLEERMAKRRENEEKTTSPSEKESEEE